MTITRLHTTSDERLTPYLRLTGRQLKNVLAPQDALVIGESLFVIRLAASLGLDIVSVLVDERHLDRLLSEVPALEDLDVPILVASRELMSGVVGFEVTRGYMAAIRRPAPRTSVQVLEGARHVAVLENLVDVTNVGAIFRSAAALGADAVILSPGCADPYNRRSIRTSMGNVFTVPWAPAPGPWPRALFDTLHEKGFCTWAMALSPDAGRLGEVRPPKGGRLALFFGSEGQGLSRPVLERADARVSIPMSRGVDSLNVAASSAVAFWELFSKDGAGA